MGRVGKSRLIERVSEKTDIPSAKVGEVISLLFETITDELAKGNAVTVTGFGSWRSKVHTPRKGHNPRTGGTIDIPARNRVQFRAGSKLRSRVEHTIDARVFFGEGMGGGAKPGNGSVFQFETRMQHVPDLEDPSRRTADIIERLRAKLEELELNDFINSADEDGTEVLQAIEELGDAADELGDAAAELGEAAEAVEALGSGALDEERSVEVDSELEDPDSSGLETPRAADRSDARP